MLSTIWRVLISVSLCIVPAYPVFAQVSFFQPPIFQGTGNLIVADFNRDGKPDVLTSDGTLQLGIGGGAFASPTTVPGTPLLVADFNGDGIPDILEQGTNTLLVLLGNGDGTFQPASSTANTATILGLVAADLNGDNKADLVGVSGTSLLVFISKGDGTFAVPVAYNLGTSSTLAVVSPGDFNADGKMDVAVGISGEEIVFLGNGDGTLKTPGITSSTGSSLDFATAGDFNGDGKLDLAVSEPGSVPSASVYILLGNGDGTFGAPVLAFTGDGPLVAADVNGDGKLDLLLLSASNGFVQVFLGSGGGTFFNTSNYAPLPYSFILNSAVIFVNSVGIAVADFNNDGKLDIAVGGGAIFFGIGDGTFQGVPVAAATIGSAIAGSFGKNHTPAIANVSGAQVSIFAMNGNTLFLTHTYTLQGSGSGLVAADFNGDGNIDLAIVGTDSQNQNWNYSVLLGNADGSFQSPIFSQHSGSLTGSIALGDFNNDNNPDLVVGAGGQGQLAVLLGKGDGTFAPPVYINGFQSSIIADFNGDGNLDIAGISAENTVISYGNGDGTFQPPVSPPSLNGFYPYLTADVNNDGKADLIAGGCTNCTSIVALGHGDGTFTQVPCCFPPTGQVGAFSIPFIADFNGDGIVDYLAERAYDRAPYIVLGIGDGTFGGPGGGYILAGFYETLVDSLSPVWPLFAADVNGDGRPDIVSGFRQNGLAVLLNTTPALPDFSIGAGPGLTTSRTISAGQTAAFTLAVASVGWFSGTVNLSCAITPAVTPAPTCSQSSSSIQVGEGSSQSILVTVGTTASSTSSLLPFTGFVTGAPPLAGISIVLGSALLLLSIRKHRPSAGLLIMVGLLYSVACGGGGSSPHGTTPGTPPGAYSVTVTAVAGPLSHNLSLRVVVH